MAWIWRARRRCAKDADARPPAARAQRWNGPLRILQIGTRDSFGGAARAAYRLHKGLRAIGADSTYFVRDQAESDPSVRRFIPDPSPAAAHHRARCRAELTAD